MALKKISFKVQPSLAEDFKRLCSDRLISMTDMIEQLIDQYQNKDFELEFLCKVLSAERYAGKKDAVLTFRLDEEVYLKLCSKLKLDGNIRPATFFSIAMQYAIEKGDNKAAYAKLAKEILDKSAPEIAHVVFGIVYYCFSEGTWKQIAESYFIHQVTEEEFVDTYKHHTPLLKVYAVHKERR